jgi:hypothetical protein
VLVSRSADHGAIRRSTGDWRLRPVERFGAREQWDRVVAGSPAATLPQTWGYGAAKTRAGRWRVERLLVECDGEVVGAAQALVMSMPVVRRGLAWINRGPMLLGDAAHDRDAVADALAVLRQHWVEERGMYLRVAPPVRADDGDAPFAPAGFELTDVTGWMSSELDLTPSLEDLRMHSMRQKWRNCLYKAERLGVVADVSTDSAAMDRFIDAYDAHLERHDLHKSMNGRLLRALHQSVGEDDKPLVLSVRGAGDPVAWALIARYPGAGEYVAGLTLPEGRALNAGQALLWTAVVELKAQGRLLFDLGGMDAGDKASGPSQFKRGLGGQPYRLAPELEAYNGSLIPRGIRRAIGAVR